MVDIKIEGLNRKKARDIVFNLPRNQEFHVDTLKDGKKITLKTEGKKHSKIDGEDVGIHDFKVHYEGEQTKLNYIDNFLVDLLKKKLFITDEQIRKLIAAIKDSIELVPIEEIYKKYPELKELEKKQLPGHTIDFLLRIIRWMALQEDVNYWGTNPKTGEPYEGREKPYNALRDYFIEGYPLYTVIKKHRFAVVVVRA